MANPRIYCFPLPLIWSQEQLERLHEDHVTHSLSQKSRSDNTPVGIRLIRHGLGSLKGPQQRVALTIRGQNPCQDRTRDLLFGDLRFSVLWEVQIVTSRSNFLGEKSRFKPHAVFEARGNGDDILELASFGRYCIDESGIYCFRTLQ